MKPHVTFDSKTWLGLVSMHPALILECKTTETKQNPKPTTAKWFWEKKARLWHVFAQQWVQFSTVVTLKVDFMGGRVACLFSPSEVCASYLTFTKVFLGDLGRQAITYKWNKIASCMLLKISVTSPTWELKVDLNAGGDFCLQTAWRSEFRPSWNERISPIMNEPLEIQHLECTTFFSFLLCSLVLLEKVHHYLQR